MPIGDYYKYLSKSKIGYLITNIFGTLDLHSHIRLKPVLKFLNDYLKNNVNYNIMEIGCGSGINAFEIYKIISKHKKKTKIKYIGMDMDKQAIETANKLAYKTNLDDIFTFYYTDATKCIPEFQNIDTVLLIDFLEHVDNPLEILKKIKPGLRKNSIFIISVPTPNYPKCFGELFHKKVGHVRPGYTCNDLIKLFKKINGEPIYYKYNTGLISNLGCSIYYRIFISNKYANTIKSLLLYPFKFLDFYNNANVSCSLFAVFKIN